jgi:hypothetical protein
MQEQVSRRVVAALEGWQQLNEAFAEQAFLSIYGSPMLQAAVGISAAGPKQPRKAMKSPLHRELLQEKISELKSRTAAGGLREALVRATLYAGMHRRAIDERGFETARRIRQAHGDMSLAEFKALVREQFHILLLDERAALDAIPAMLPADQEARVAAFDIVQQILGARGDLSDDDEKRLKELSGLFGLGGEESGAFAGRRYAARRPTAGARSS